MVAVKIERDNAHRVLITVPGARQSVNRQMSGAVMTPLGPFLDQEPGG